MFQPQQGRLRPQTAGSSSKSNSWTFTAGHDDASWKGSQRSSSIRRGLAEDLAASAFRRNNVLSRLDAVVRNFTLKEFREEMRKEREEEDAPMNSQALSPCEVRLAYFKRELQTFLTNENSALAGLISAITSEYEAVIRHLKCVSEPESADTVRKTLTKVQLELNEKHKQEEETSARVQQLEEALREVKIKEEKTNQKQLSTQKELDELRLCFGNEAAKVLPSVDVYNVRTFTRSVHGLVREVQELRNKVQILTEANTSLVEEYNTQCDELTTALDRANDVQSQNGALKATIRLMKGKIESLESAQITLETITHERDALLFELELWKQKCKFNYQLYKHTHSLISNTLQKKLIISAGERGKDKGPQSVEPIGADMTVPVWLRATAKVTNLNYDFKTTMQLYSDLWKEKDEVDSARHTPIELTYFFMQFFKRRCGGRAQAVPEMCYSFLDACRRYSIARSDLFLLSELMRGACPEEVFTIGTARATSVRLACMKLEVDKPPPGKNKKGKIMRTDILAVIKQQFPNAPQVFMDRVEVLLLTNQDDNTSEEVNWEGLFDPEQGQLVGCFRHHVYNEYMEYLFKMQKFTVDYVRADRHSVIAVPISVLKACLQEFEPKYPGEAARRLRLGLTTMWRDTEPTDDEEPMPGEDEEETMRVNLTMFFNSLRGRCYMKAGGTVPRGGGNSPRGNSPRSQKY